jgi:hypothetical protein
MNICTRWVTGSADRWTKINFVLSQSKNDLMHITHCKWPSSTKNVNLKINIMFSLHAPALTILGIQLLPIFIVFVHLFMPWLMRKSSCHVHVQHKKCQCIFHTCIFRVLGLNERLQSLNICMRYYQAAPKMYM